jgi:hypothetical protein
MVVTRDKRLNVLVSSEEMEWLQTLADEAGITASDWVRLRIREAELARGGARATAKKTKKK